MLIIQLKYNDMKKFIAMCRYLRSLGFSNSTIKEAVIIKLEGIKFD